MPMLLPLAGAAALVAALAQAPAPAWLKPNGRVTATATIDAPAKATTGHDVVLSVDVTPAPGIHVYAPGNKDYIPVEVQLDPAPEVSAGTAVYPPSERYLFGELKEIVQVYQRPFRIRVPLALRNRSSRTAITGRLRFQACHRPRLLPSRVAAHRRDRAGASRGEPAVAVSSARERHGPSPRRRLVERDDRGGVAA